MEDSRKDEERNPYGNPYGSGQYPPPYGTEYHPHGQHPVKPVSGFAIASLILGILSLLSACCTGVGGLVLGVLGIVFAILSRGKEPMENQAKIGLGTSIGGVVLGLIITIIALLLVTSSSFQSEFSDELQRYGGGLYDEFEEYEEETPKMPGNGYNFNNGL